MDKDLAEFAIHEATSLGASYAEARLESVKDNGFVLKNGIPEISSFDKYRGLGVRLIYNRRLGFFSTNKPTKSKINELLNKTISALQKSGSIHNNTDLSSEKAHQNDYEVKEKIKCANVSPEEKLGTLQDIEKALKESQVKVPGRYLALADTLTKKYIVTSEGARIYSKIPHLSFFYYLTVKRGNSTCQRYWQFGNTGGFEYVKKWNLPKTLTDEVMNLDKNLAHGKKAPSGKIDLVAGPEVTGIMCHESCGHPLEADRIVGRESAQAGESFVKKDMKGYKIGSEAVTIVDDPTLENSFGYFKYDDEGVKSRRKFLYKKGLITEFLHNRETSKILGLKSNGSSRANAYDREAIVRMSNTFMLPGKYSEEELITGVKNGIYMKNFNEWNIDDKRLNQKYVGGDCYLIKNGELSYPIKLPVIEVSTLKLYHMVDAVADNVEYHAGTCGKGEPMQGIPAWLGGPSIRLRGIRLGK